MQGNVGAFSCQIWIWIQILGLVRYTYIQVSLVIVKKKNYNQWTPNKKKWKNRKTKTVVDTTRSWIRNEWSAVEISRALPWTIKCQSNLSISFLISKIRIKKIEQTQQYLNYQFERLQTPSHTQEVLCYRKNPDLSFEIETKKGNLTITNKELVFSLPQTVMFSVILISQEKGKSCRLRIESKSKRTGKKKEQKKEPTYLWHGKLWKEHNL